MIFFFSALFAQNKSYAIALVSTKLGFLISPIFFALILPKKITPKIICITVLFFITGSMWGLIECFAIGIYNYVHEIAYPVIGENSVGIMHFLGARFSFNMHPSYFTLYLDLCLLFLFLTRMYNIGSVRKSYSSFQES